MSPTPWDLPPRIAAKIAVDAESGCWLWTAAQATGYGALNVGGKVKRAHRVVYELIAYEVPEGLELDHLCRIKRCCNPRHVEPVTPLENKHRYAAEVQSRPTYPCGHPRTEENTKALPFRNRPHGRVCLACQRESSRAWNTAERARQRAAA